MTESVRDETRNTLNGLAVVCAARGVRHDVGHDDEDHLCALEGYHL